MSACVFAFVVIITLSYWGEKTRATVTVSVNLEQHGRLQLNSNPDEIAWYYEE